MQFGQVPAPEGPGTEVPGRETHLPAIPVDPQQIVVHTGCLIEGDDGQATLKPSAKHGGTVRILRRRWLAVDVLDLARLYKSCRMVGVGGALEAEDGIGNGVLIALAGRHPRRDDVLIAEDAWDTGVVVIEISFQPLQNLFQRGHLPPLRTQHG
jgi:hypothetical protein